jgi:hypothetical protein
MITFETVDNYVFAHGYQEPDVQKCVFIRYLREYNERECE